MDENPVSEPGLEFFSSFEFDLSTAFDTMSAHHQFFMCSIAHPVALEVKRNQGFNEENNSNPVAETDSMFFFIESVHSNKHRMES